MEYTVGKARGTGRRHTLVDSHKRFKEAFEKAGQPKFFVYTEESEANGKVTARIYRNRTIWALRKKFDRIQQRKKGNN
jgi:hypothetical protein